MFGTGPRTGAEIDSEISSRIDGAHFGRDVQARRSRSCFSKDYVHVGGRREVCEGGDVVPTLWRGERVECFFRSLMIVCLALVARRRLLLVRNRGVATWQAGLLSVPRFMCTRDSLRSGVLASRLRHMER